MDRIALGVAGALAIAFGGWALFVARRDGDKPFHNAQRYARSIRHPVVLPVWAMKVLFYPAMLGLIVFGGFVLGSVIGWW